MKLHQAPKAKEILKKFYCWFDYSQLVELIVMKLRYDAENYREHSFCVDVDIKAEQMIKCANFLEKSYDDMNYHDERQEGDKKYGVDYNAREIYNDQIKDLKIALDIIEKNLFSWWD